MRSPGASTSATMAAAIGGLNVPRAAARAPFEVAILETPGPSEAALPLSAEELREAWPLMSGQDRLEGFRLLARADADDFFLDLGPYEQRALLDGLPAGERRTLLRLVAPDDAADLLQEYDPEEREAWLQLLDDSSRREVQALLAYAEDAAGGLMSPRFVRLRPEMSVDEAIRYLRRQRRESVETFYYAYVLDASQRLLGVVSLRELVQALPEKTVREIMVKDPVTVPEQMDQEAVSRVFGENASLMALPVVDPEGRMKGIVTADDIVDVVEEEATEDIHKVGGQQALDAPYLETSFREMVKKRAGWLSILLVGEMLTTSAMTFFEDEIARAVVLALFLPLIISSGGNSGSQASTLIIRAMALGEVQLRDWLRVLWRELRTGIMLGVILGVIGLVRVLVWQRVFGTYGPHAALLALTVGLSLIGIVLLGTISGSMLPFVLRRLGFDPASASAPFVATLVDVTGVILYFCVAALVLSGTLL